MCSEDPLRGSHLTGTTSAKRIPAGYTSHELTPLLNTKVKELDSVRLLIDNNCGKSLRLSDRLQWNHRLNMEGTKTRKTQTRTRGVHCWYEGSSVIHSPVSQSSLIRIGKIQVYSTTQIRLKTCRSPNANATAEPQTSQTWVRDGGCMKLNPQFLMSSEFGCLQGLSSIWVIWQLFVFTFEYKRIILIILSRWLLSSIGKLKCRKNSPQPVKRVAIFYLWEPRVTHRVHRHKLTQPCKYQLYTCIVVRPDCPLSTRMPQDCPQYRTRALHTS